ncbi:SCO family protein [Candidatus Thiosymbion oneisti]|uniref:SCO family protein n=1 Tax=Candidatus Thiosymbion oneisti TaxID=589554 RepID=UPI000B085735|nr:SCO family protein [Candidatus Thiosymbion oneisti]
MTHNAGGGLRRLLIPVGVLVGVLAVAAGVWFGVSRFDPGAGTGPPVAAMRAGTPLPQPKVLSPFTLTDQDARPFGLEDLRGHWTFVSIGFTACGGVCPTNMATYRAIDREIGTAGAAEPAVDFLFISVDPERDSPEQLRQYVRRFDPGFRGATGSHDQLQPLVRELGLMYGRSEEAGDAMGYMVDHSASILLLDPQARLVAVFSWPHDSAAMAADFAVLHDHY